MGAGATESGHRHHFAAAGLDETLGTSFTIERVARTEVGLRELVQRAVMMPRAGRAAAVLMPFQFVARRLDDLAPAGLFAYHLAVRARSSTPGGER